MIELDGAICELQLHINGRQEGDRVGFIEMSGLMTQFVNRELGVTYLNNVVRYDYERDGYRCIDNVLKVVPCCFIQ